MSSQVDATGFTLKTQATINAELETSFRAQFGDGINVGPASAFGRLIGIMGATIFSDQELAQAVWVTLDPNQAFGIGQDDNAQAVGVTRLDALQSTATATLNLDASITVPAGSIVSVSGNPTARFTLDVAVTSTTSGNYTGEFTAEAFGPTEAFAASLSVIETPISGWNTVTNAADAEEGRDIETDAELRLRRLSSTQISGRSTVGSMRSKIGEIEGVEFVKVIENDSDATVNGRPAHSMEVITFGGDEQIIANTIWDNKAGGIEMVTTQTGGDALATDVTDSELVIHSVIHSRATQVLLYVDVNIDVTSTITAAEDTAIQTGIVAEGGLLGVGDDVILFKLGCIAAITSNSKIQTVVIEVGLATDPTQITNYVISETELARFDTTRVDVNPTLV